MVCVVTLESEVFVELANESCWLLVASELADGWDFKRKVFARVFQIWLFLADVQAYSGPLSVSCMMNSANRYVLGTYNGSKKILGHGCGRGGALLG